MQNILLLIVEDEVLIPLEVETALHDGGYLIETETSGKQRPDVDSSGERYAIA